MKKNIQTRGFTLIEILVAITLLGILAAMVIPRFTGQLVKARAAEATNMLGVIRQALITYKNGPAGNYDAVGEWNPTLGGCGKYILLSLGDPNENPNRFYDYCIQIGFVSSGGSHADQAMVVASKRTSDGSNPTESIALNDAGVWSGVSPYVPQNPNGCQCGAAECPEPCCNTMPVCGV